MTTPDAGGLAPAEEKVHFFGRVIASVSHELKNALATVSESAGLLSDLLIDLESGDEARSETQLCGETITEELRRAFAIIATLNAFAHTADETVGDVDVRHVAGIVATLSGYRSNSRAVDVSGDPIRIRTCALLLEELLYGVLVAVFELRLSREPVAVEVGGDGGGVELRLHGLGTPIPMDLLPDREARVLATLGGDMTIGPEEGTIEVRLPPAIDGAGS